MEMSHPPTAQRRQLRVNGLSIGAESTRSSTQRLSGSLIAVVVSVFRHIWKKTRFRKSWNSQSGVHFHQSRISHDPLHERFPKFRCLCFPPRRFPWRASFLAKATRKRHNRIAEIAPGLRKGVLSSKLRESVETVSQKSSQGAARVYFHQIRIPWSGA